MKTDIKWESLCRKRSPVRATTHLFIAYPKNSVTISTLPFSVISFFVPVDVDAIECGNYSCGRARGC